VRSPSPEEEKVTETVCDELTTTSICHPPVPLGRDEVEGLGVKKSPGRRERWGKVLLRFGFISLYPTLI